MTPLSMTTENDRLSEAGFSLVELLVSLTLLAMILALLPGAFITGKRGWESASAIEQRAATTAAMDYLRHRIAETAPVFDKDESGRSRLAFTGARDRLSFVAPAPSGPAGGGLYRFIVTAEPDTVTGNSAVTLSMTPYIQSGTQRAPVVSKHVLMPAVSTIQLRYFGSQDDGQPAEWSNAWRRDDRLPAIVELQAESLSAGAASPIRVDLKMTSSANNN